MDGARGQAEPTGDAPERAVRGRRRRRRPAALLGLAVIGTAVACVDPPPPPTPTWPTPPPGFECRPGDFEQAIVEQGPPDGTSPGWHLSVRGMASSSSTYLIPAAGAAADGFRRIDVQVCSQPGMPGPGVLYAYVATIDLRGVTGRRGVRVVGHQRSEDLAVPPPPSAPRTFLQGTNWELSGSLIGGTPVPAGSVVTVSFDATSVTGSAGCNAFQASYRTVGDRITIGPVSSTDRACAPDVAAAEAAYLDTLATSTQFRLDPWSLTLSRSAGDPLRFASTPH